MQYTGNAEISTWRTQLKDIGIWLKYDVYKFYLAVPVAKQTLSCNSLQHQAITYMMLFRLNNAQS